MSNGHGEVAIADRIAAELPSTIACDHLALVGALRAGSGERGSSRMREVGPRRSMPSGGLIAMGNVRNILRDLQAGLTGPHPRAAAIFARGRAHVSRRSGGGRRICVVHGAPCACCRDDIRRDGQERVRRALWISGRARHGTCTCRICSRRSDGAVVARSRNCRASRKRHRRSEYAGVGCGGRRCIRAASGNFSGKPGIRIRRCNQTLQCRTRTCRLQTPARRAAFSCAGSGWPANGLGFAAARLARRAAR